MKFLLPAFIGIITGIISGFGVGGGTLLMIFMTAFAGIEQTTAQGINLLYFIPTSASSLYSHIKNKFVDWQAVIPAAICGSLVTVLAAIFATGIDTGLLKKLFGGFLIIVGISELLRKDSLDKKG